jgi:hypothetical protein
MNGGQDQHNAKDLVTLQPHDEARAKTVLADRAAKEGQQDRYANDGG